MKRASLLAAAAVIVITNAFALLHAWRNRSGPVESEVTLTERELNPSYRLNNEEDSEVTLNLIWTDPHQRRSADGASAPWLDQKLLQELGFDTHVAASDTAAYGFYPRQRPRRAFVALEYDGPAWRNWREAEARKAEALRSQFPNFPDPAKQTDATSRLVAIDAGNDAARLRARHPDRASVIIVPAVIRIVLEPKDANGAARLTGWVQQVPAAIHVPLPFSDAFRRQPVYNRTVKYRVHLRYGTLFEPWITGVEFPTDANR